VRERREEKKEAQQTITCGRDLTAIKESSETVSRKKEKSRRRTTSKPEILPAYTTHLNTALVAFSLYRRLHGRLNIKKKFFCNKTEEMR